MRRDDPKWTRWLDKLPQFKPWQSIAIVLFVCLILAGDYAQGHWTWVDRIMVGLLALLFFCDLMLWWLR